MRTLGIVFDLDWHPGATRSFPANASMATLSSSLASIYHLTPAIAVEYFDTEALIFLAEVENFLTVNRAAADLLVLLQTAFEARSFERQSLIDLLLQHYDLDPLAAAGAADRLLVDWVTFGILLSLPAAELSAC